MQITLNGQKLSTDVCDYAALRLEHAISADTLLIDGHNKPWQTPLQDGNEVLMFDSWKSPDRALWRAIYDARYGRDIMERLQNAQVAVCGLGGLGSLLALELARLGVGQLLLIDGDRVEPSNLARQHYSLKQIGMNKAEALAHSITASAPLTHTKSAVLWLSPDNIAPLLSGYHLICECLDRPENKAMLVQNVLSSLPDAILISTSGMAGFGSGNEIKAKRLLPRLYQVGDGTSEGEEGIGLMAPRVGLCASAQATLVMRLILNELEP